MGKVFINIYMNNSLNQTNVLSDLLVMYKYLLLA